jgi:DNA polymerase-3 subunit delta'
MTWNLIGHDWAIQLLRGHIVNDSLRHAYLVTGPRGIGKANLAIRFIQALNCPEQGTSGNPCLNCPSCNRIGRFEHPDLFPVSVIENSKQIKVDQIRELIHSLALSPYESSRRYGLLLDFEHANPSAQNSILKTLEEPPGSVVLIVTANSADALLETITSRCEEIKLKPVPIDLTSQGLEQLHNIPSDQAHYLAQISGGKPEIALAMHSDPEILERRTILLDEHLQILRGNSVVRFAYADQISKDSRKVGELLDIWVSIWQDILHQSSQSQVPLQNIDREDDIRQIRNQIDLEIARNSVDLLRRAHNLLNINANLKLTLEDLLLGLPRIAPFSS